MRRLSPSWQERPGKRARLEGGRSFVGSEPTDGSARSQLRNHVDGTMATKRGLSMDNAVSPKKMKRVDDPGCTFNSGSTASPCIPATPSTAVSPENDSSRQYEAAGQHAPSRRWLVPRAQRYSEAVFRLPGVPVLCRIRLSPYTLRETPQQRREDRERDREIQRARETKRNLIALPWKSESTMDAVSAKSLVDGGRPKDRLKEGDQREGGNQDGFETQNVAENSLEAKQSGKDNLKHGDDCLVLRLNKPESRANGQSWRSSEDQAPEKLSESADTEEDVFPAEMVPQLLSDYADSQKIVMNLRQINEQHAEQIETLTVQLSQFEVRHQEDELIIAAHIDEIKHIREEHDKECADMRERTETLNKRHLEDQEIISEHQQQVASLSSQLAHTSETNRLELARFKRFKLDSQRELASQQQTLTTCLARYDRLRSATSRQRECLECSICLCLFSHPVTLNCGHTFCEACIETNRRSAVVPDSCPLCRRVIRVSVRSAVIEQLADLSLELEQCHV